MSTLLSLGEFEIRASSDPAKHVPQVVHRLCGEQVCDVESHGTLEILVGMAISHQCGELPAVTSALAVLA